MWGKLNSNEGNSIRELTYFHTKRDITSIPEGEIRLSSAFAQKEFGPRGAKAHALGSGDLGFIPRPCPFRFG